MREKTGKQVNLTTIRRLTRQPKLRDSLMVSTEDIEDHLLEACKQFREVHKRAKALNRNHPI